MIVAGQEDRGHKLSNQREGAAFPIFKQEYCRSPWYVYGSGSVPYNQNRNTAGLHGVYHREGAAFPIFKQEKCRSPCYMSNLHLDLLDLLTTLDRQVLENDS